MNVIGIVQTDLNEFNILFEPEQQQQPQQQQQGDQQQGGQQESGGVGDFLSFFSGAENGGNGGGPQGHGQSGQQQTNQGPQEMVVRIKGIPEGQKATFLQMYQIIQDAQGIQDLERQLTIVSREDQQQQGQKQGQKQN